MRGHLIAGMLALGCCCMPSVAWACIFNVDTIRLGDPGDPDEPGIGKKERERREALVRQNLATRQREDIRLWRNEARAGRGESAEIHARALIESLVQEPGGFVSEGACSTSVRPRWPDPDYEAAKTALLETRTKFARFRLGEFSYSYAMRVEGCGDEMTARLVRYLVAHTDPAMLAAVWYEVHRLGFDRSEWSRAEPLLTFGQGLLLQPRLATGQRAYLVANGHGDQLGSYRLEREAEALFNRQQSKAMERILAEDESAITVIAALQKGILELSDETQPYNGLCPETTKGLAEFIAKEVEAVRPRRPTVELLL